MLAMVLAARNTTHTNTDLELWIAVIWYPASLSLYVTYSHLVKELSVGKNSVCGFKILMRSPSCVGYFMSA